MNTKYDVSVILVNYNGKKYIDALFGSLVNLKHDGFSFQVIFEDNGSYDGSVEYLTSLIPSLDLNVKIVDTKDNLGFAGGNNFGIKNCEGKYIVLLNNDTVVDEYWLQNLYRFFLSQENCVMANSKLLFFYDYIKLTFKTNDKIIFDRNVIINNKEYYADGKFIKNCLCEEKELICFGHTEIMLPLLDGNSQHKFALRTKHWNESVDTVICNGKEYKAENGLVTIDLNEEAISKRKITLIQNAGSGINDVYNGFDIGFCEPDGEKYLHPYEINNGCGAAIIMNKEDFLACGGFDEQFFMYYEDTDLSYRIKANGGKIIYCPDSVVRHIHTGSSSEWSPFFTYHVYRNKLLFLYKNISTGKFLYYFIRQLFEGFRYRDKSKIKGCLDAFRIAILKKKGIQY